MSDDVFTVFAYDMNTNTPICEVPANGLSFDRRLNDVGSAQFSIKLDDPKTAAQVAPLMEYAGRPWALYIDRDDTLVWGGWAKTGQYKHSAHTLPVGAKEWPDYFSRRLIGSVLDATVYPDGVDPAALFARAVTDAQSVALCGPGANMGIGVTGGSSKLPKIVPSYQVKQAYVSQVIADCVQTVMPGTGGLDYYTDVFWDTDGTPAVVLRICTPRAGRTARGTGLIIDLLDAVDFGWPTDVSNSVTSLTETGGGTGLAQVTVTVQAPGVPVGGLGQMPRLDRTIQHSNILDSQFLLAVAQGEAQEFGGPVAVPTVTITTDHPDVPLGSYIPGDDVRLRAEPHEFRPGGIDEFWRLVQWNVKVPDEGVPTVDLAFNAPPIY